MEFTNKLHSDVEKYVFGLTTQYIFLRYIQFTSKKTNKQISHFHMVQLKLLLFSKRHRFVLDPLLLILALVQKYYKTPPSPEKKGLYVNFNKKKHEENKMKNYTVFNFPGKKLLSTCSKFQSQNSHVLLKLNKFQDHWRMKIKNFNRKINKYIFPNSVGALEKVEGCLSEKNYKQINCGKLYLYG